MKKKIVFIIPIIAIIGFLIYKSCLLIYFSGNGFSDYEEVYIKEKKVSVDKSLANTKIENINLYIPIEFVGKEVRTGYYIYTHNSKNISITLGKSRSCCERTIDESKPMQTIGYEKLMKKNNMISDSDLIKYYFTQRKKNNIFTSNNDIKMSYLSEVCVNNSIINPDKKDSNYYFSGDLDGVLYTKNNKSYWIEIYNENEKEYYSVSVTNSSKEIDDDSVVDEIFNQILKSVYFD